MPDFVYSYLTSFNANSVPTKHGTVLEYVSVAENVAGIQLFTGKVVPYKDLFIRTVYIHFNKASLFVWSDGAKLLKITHGVFAELPFRIVTGLHMFFYRVREFLEFCVFPVGTSIYERSRAFFLIRIQ